MRCLSFVLNWHKYNESLVRCSEIVLDFDVVIDNWHSDLNGMNNKGKEGRKEGRSCCLQNPDSFIHSFVQLLGYMRVYFHHLP